MKERLIADWLTKAGERGGLDVAFCQILLARGCRILQARHSPTENGKDIITVEPDKRLTAAHRAWTAEVYKLPPKAWEDSFQLTKAAALAALERLASETIEPNALVPHEPELDDYTRMRNTIAASAVAACFLIQRRADQNSAPMDKGIPLIHRLVTDGRIFFWGESALPHFLVICWMLEQSGQGWLAEGVMLSIVGALTKFNQKLSAHPLSGPETLADEVFSSILKRNSKPEKAHGRRAPVSWSLESLLHLLAIRMRRQALKARWWDITHVEMASFRPNRAADVLLWHTAAGEEMERLAGNRKAGKNLPPLRGLMISTRCRQYSKMILNSR